MCVEVLPTTYEGTIWFKKNNKSKKLAILSARRQRNTTHLCASSGRPKRDSDGKGLGQTPGPVPFLRAGRSCCISLLSIRPDDERIGDCVYCINVSNVERGAIFGG
jgi:predicted DNA-binding helix-hairpin-helix protein